NFLLHFSAQFPNLESLYNSISRWPAKGKNEMAKSNNAADGRVMSPLNLLMKVAPGRKTGLRENNAAVSAVIKAGADAIGTLHEARFVQIDDDTVMLLTTYDGDFDTYIDDFTKHLSEVFNMLLPNVVDPPPLPVEKN